ncbi:4853_t:CDS:2 [Entrophospora sp. SA101]|nr:4853_t:CDS:2 [Entrophospora sp. SA101]
MKNLNNKKYALKHGMFDELTAGLTTPLDVIKIHGYLLAK